MVVEIPLLSLVTYTPLLGALFVFLIRGQQEKIDRNSRLVGLFMSIVTFLIAVMLWIDFRPELASYQFVEEFDWLPSFNISYHMGVDGISLPFILLNTFLIPICIISSWNSIQFKVKEFIISFLILETLINGMFCALDMVLFYIFFEGVLIPMFLIIGIWGGQRRIYAAFKFFLYTLLGSVLMLVAILVMYSKVGTTDIPALTQFDFEESLQLWLWLAFFASFAVKVPMWPVHTWLPDAHVEAPTAGSVILAGILLKMGGYGFLRFSLPIFPEASQYFADFVFYLSLVAIVYTSLVALAQTDMKKLIAYSSVAHMGFVTLGIFTFNQQGIEGAVMQMISHGLVSAALFLCVGVIYDRMHTRQIKDFGGLVHRMPLYAVVFMIFTLASVGLPGTSGFVGEFLILVGAYQVKGFLTVVAATALILGAAYALWLYKRVIFGDLTKEPLKSISDLKWNEKLVFAPLVAFVLWLGIYPSSLLESVQASSDQLKETIKVARVSPYFGTDQEHQFTWGIFEE